MLKAHESKGHEVPGSLKLSVKQSCRLIPAYVSSPPLTEHPPRPFTNLVKQSLFSLLGKREEINPLVGPTLGEQVQSKEYSLNCG